MLGKQKYRIDPNVTMYAAQQEADRQSTVKQLDITQPSTKDERSVESKVRAQDSSVE